MVSVGKIAIKPVVKPSMCSIDKSKFSEENIKINRKNKREIQWKKQRARQGENYIAFIAFARNHALQ